MALRDNYPLPGAGGAVITALDGVNGWDAQALRGVRDELNGAGAGAGAQRWGSLVALAKAVELRLAAMDQSQTPAVILKGKIF